MGRDVSPKRRSSVWSSTLRPPLTTRRWQTRSPLTTRNSSATSVMTLSSGWTPTSWPRLRNSKRSRRRLRPSATRSSPSCTSLPEVPVCPTWEECPEECLELAEPEEPLPEEVQALDPPSRRSTKIENYNSIIYKI